VGRAASSRAGFRFLVSLGARLVVDDTGAACFFKDDAVVLALPSVSPGERIRYLNAL